MKTSNFLEDLLTSFLSACVFAIIDYFSVGGQLFNIPQLNPDATIFFSSSIYVITAFLGQLIFGLTSSINTGIIATIVFEAVIISRKIATVCYEELSRSNKNLNMADLYANIYICMGISTLIFAFISLMPYIYKSGDLLKDIPLVAVYAVMSSIALSLFEYAFAPYSAALTSSNITLISCTLFGALSIFVIDKRFPRFSYLIPSATLAIVIIFNFVTRISLKYSTADLCKTGLILDFGRSKDLRLWDFIGLFKGFKIVPACILKNLGNILSMALFNLIHININVQPYGFVTGNPIDLNCEWRTQSIANFFNVFTGYPSYFVNISSIFFFKSGGKYRLSSVIASGAPLLVGVLSPYIRDYVPNILSSIILLYISFALIQGYIYEAINICSRMDMYITLFSILICQLIGVVAGFSIAIAMASVCILRYYWLELQLRSGKVATIPYESEEQRKIIKVEYILCFMTTSRLKHDLRDARGEITLDLSNCIFIDMNANLFILNFAKTLDRLRIIGKPVNFYTKLFESVENIYLTERQY